MQNFTHLASVGIIYRQLDPTQLFMEIKDDGYPVAAFRRHLNLIGGNWIGDSARSDRSPLETFRRELDEDLSLTRPLRHSTELTQLGLADNESFLPTPISGVPIGRTDQSKLVGLRGTIKRSCVPIGDWSLTVPADVLQRLDPKNTRPGWKALVCYWAVPTGEEDWSSLVALQEKFGNLSCESVTVLTSLDEIVETKPNIAFGHDLILQLFYLALGFEQANWISCVKGITAEYLGTSLLTYGHYAARYTIERQPH